MKEKKRVALLMLELMKKIPINFEDSFYYQLIFLVNDTVLKIIPAF